MYLPAVAVGRCCPQLPPHLQLAAPLALGPLRFGAAAGQARRGFAEAEQSRGVCIVAAPKKNTYMIDPQARSPPVVTVSLILFVARTAPGRCRPTVLGSGGRWSECSAVAATRGRGRSRGAAAQREAETTGVTGRDIGSDVFVAGLRRCWVGGTYAQTARDREGWDE